jgi:hypothetical protein
MVGNEVMGGTIQVQTGLRPRQEDSQKRLRRERWRTVNRKSSGQFTKFWDGEMGSDRGNESGRFDVMVITE